MQTEAIFENIADRICEEIISAKKSIYIAVAWFTNQNIFNLLLEKANKGCHVSLLISNDEINNSSRIDFNRLNTLKSKVYKVGNGENDLMHNKFCVIDFSTVITGSYNWSYKAENNFENIVITENDTILAEKFVEEFEKIRRLYFPDNCESEQKEFPLNVIVKRLEILKNYVQLEDIEAIHYEIKKLTEYKFNPELEEIIILVSNHDYSKTIEAIQYFTNRYNQIIRWNDPLISALKWEIKLLENRITAYDNEKIEIEKLLSQFQHRHSLELGDLILEILKLRKIKFKDDKEKYDEAFEDEYHYKKQYEKDKQKTLTNLNEVDKMKLKKNFRKATSLCHPDKVDDDFKAEAQNIFIELKSAYDENDLARVTEILISLENGKQFDLKSDTITEKEKLKAMIIQLKRKLEQIEKELDDLHKSAILVEIKNIGNWDQYFNENRELLKCELEKLINE